MASLSNGMQRAPCHGGDYAGPLTADGRRPTSLPDVVKFALSISEGGSMPLDLVVACREVVLAAEGAP